MVRSITFLEAGYTEQFEKFVNPVSGHWKKIRFPATVAVIEHAKAGIILFDTGYSPRLFETAKYFEEKVYSLLTPIHIQPEETAFERIKKLGLNPHDVSHVVLSHFHSDHIAGAADFTKAQYIYSQHELNYFKSMSPLLQLKNAFIAGLLPTDIENRAMAADEFPIPIPELGEGWKGKDLFGDESIFAVPLPGHTLGQIGLYIRDVNGKDYLLVADAAWLTESFQKNILPMRFIQEVFFQREAYRQTLARIHELYCKQPKNSRLQIRTCHCDLV